MRRWGSRGRVALIALGVAAILFVFVFPTRSYLAQRRQVSAAAHDVALLRGAHREPIVIRNAPLLHDGTPMPTRYWLVDPELSKRVARLESTGGVRAAEAAVDPEDLRATHDRYAHERDAVLPRGHRGPRP